MKKTPILGVTLATALLLGIAGCSQASTTPSTSSSKNNATSSSAPSDSTSTVGQTKIAQLQDAQGTYTDATSSGTILRDRYGDYQTIKLADTSALNSLDKSKVIQINSAKTSVYDASLNGKWSDADILSAQKFFANYLTTVAIDSKALDNSDEASFVKHQIYSTFLDKSKFNKESDLKDSDWSSLLLFKGNTYYKNLFPTMARDSQPRESNVQISLIKVADYNKSGKDAIEFNAGVNVDYRAKISDLLTLAKAQGWTPKSGIAPSDISTYSISDSFNFALTKTSDSWRISAIGLGNGNSAPAMGFDNVATLPEG